ncbi:MAG: lysoplasmalogenase [Deltaproteobacteria bacterium]|nr:lysoplasmalogenase [Deltaproteobacteria bacterium]
MKILSIALSILCAASVLGHLAAEHSGNKILRGVTKTLASLAFVATAWTLGAWGTPYGQVVMVALVLCAIGDVLLLGRATAAFLGGLGSFLLGHIALAVAFYRCGLAPGWLPTALFALGVVGGGVLRWLLPNVERKMQGPVLAYCAAITAMLAIAIATAGQGTSVLVPLGAALFYLSDLSVARDRFVKPGFVNRIWGLPVYYASTLILAWSVQFVSR